MFFNILWSDCFLVAFALCHDSFDDFTADGCDFPFDVPHTGFPGVFADEFAYSPVGDFQVAFTKAMGFPLFGQKELFCDLQPSPTLNFQYASRPLFS